MIRMREFQGRTGNLLLQNVGMSVLSKKFDLRVERYAELQESEVLGLSLSRAGRSIPEVDEWPWIEPVELYSCESKPREKGVSMIGTFQDKEFVLKHRDDIQDHFSLTRNPRKESDVFVHVRLGDVSHVNPGYEYYRKSIESLNRDQVFIATDSPHHQTVSRLAEEFEATLVFLSPVRTIDFAKDFKNIVLSKGTFSWWCGFLAEKSSRVIFPTGDPAWYGDIFVFDEWVGVPI